MQTTQLYNVVIPDGIKSGQQFQAALGGTIQTLTCPPNLMGGMTMQVNLSQPTAVPVASAIPIAASNVVPVLVPPPQAGVAVVVQQPPVKQAFDIGGPQDANKKDKNGFENLGPAGVGSPGYKAILIFLLYAILSGGEYALSSTSLSRILFGAFVDRGVIGNIYFPVEGNVRDEWPFWVMATFGIIAACFVIGEFVHSSSGGKNLLRAVNFTICATIMPGAWYTIYYAIDSDWRMTDKTHNTYIVTGAITLALSIFASHKLDTAARSGGDHWTKRKVETLSLGLGLYYLSLAMVILGGEIMRENWEFYFIFILAQLALTGLAGIALRKKLGLPLLYFGYLLQQGTYICNVAINSDTLWGVGITHCVAAGIVLLGIFLRESKFYVVALDVNVAAVCFMAFKTGGIAYIGGIAGFIGCIISFLFLFSDSHEGLKTTFRAGNDKTLKLMTISGFLLGMYMLANAWIIYEDWKGFRGSIGWDRKVNGFIALGLGIFGTVLSVKGVTELRK